jgi:integrase
MGMIYRRKQRDPASRKLTEVGPYWIKYYIEGRPIQESTKTVDRDEAKRLLKEKEGDVAKGLYRGPKVERTKFEDLADLVKQDYQLNKRKTLRRIGEYLLHLKPFFGKMRAVRITTERVKAYIVKRQSHGAANGTINRELGYLKRMFRLGFEQTPQLVARIPHIPQLKEHNIRSGFFEHEDFLALRGALPDYAQVAVSLAYYSGMRMGEVCSLQWRQINWTEGKLFLQAQDTKTNTPRVLFLTGDLYRVLHRWKSRCDLKWPACPWICHRGGIRLQTLLHSWRKACEAVGLGQMEKDATKGRKVWKGKIPHDFRRTAVRNMVRAGVPEKVAMAISGHKTRSVFDRYNIVNEKDLEQAARSLSAYFEKQTVTIAVTMAELSGESSGSVNCKEVESSADFLEQARGIEPPTCGLQNRCSAIELRQPAMTCLDEHRARIVTAHPSNSSNILSRNFREEDPSSAGLSCLH